jgi:hypothetical protein
MIGGQGWVTTRTDVPFNRVQMACQASEWIIFLSPQLQGEFWGKAQPLTFQVILFCLCSVLYDTF